MSKLYETPDKRWDAIRRAERAQGDEVKAFENIQKSLLSKDKAPTNACWEYLTLVLPQMVWTNPTLIVESSIPGEAAYNAIGLQYALESLMRKQELSSEWEQIFSDAIAWRGVSMVTTEVNHAPRYRDGLTLFDWHKGESKLGKGAGRECESPRMIRLDPTDFFIDSEAPSHSRARFMGHCWDGYLADLRYLSEDGEDWDIDLLESIGATKTPGREEDPIRLYEFFLPGVLDPKAIDAHEREGRGENGETYRDYEDPIKSGLYTGTVYTMAANGDGGKDVRGPRLYRGPICGPYGIYEGAPVPGQAKRLAPLMAVKNQIDEHARVGRAVIKACESYKSVAVTAFSEISELIKDAPNGEVANADISPEMLKNSIAELSIGGPPRELIDAWSITRSSLDEALGLSDSKRGIASTNTTATGDAIADKASDMRLALLKEGCQKRACDQVWVMAWHIEHAHNFEEPLPQAALAKSLSHFDMEPDNDGAVAVYLGGDALNTERPGRAFESKALKFVPQSMERTSEATQQRRAIQTLDAIARLSEIQMNNPNLDIGKIAERFGQQMNLPGLGEDFKQMSAQQQAQMQPQMQQGLPAGGGGLPGNATGQMAVGDQG